MKIRQDFRTRGDRRIEAVRGVERPYLLEQGLRVTGADISPSAVAKLAAQAKPYGHRLTTEGQDARF